MVELKNVSIAFVFMSCFSVERLIKNEFEWNCYQSLFPFVSYLSNNTILCVQFIGNSEITGSRYNTEDMERGSMVYIYILTRNTNKIK